VAHVHALLSAGQLREVRRGPVRPAAGNFCMATVSDGGQRKPGGEDGEELE
jgi:hypothetical protein